MGVQRVKLAGKRVVAPAGWAASKSKAPAVIDEALSEVVVMQGCQSCQPKQGSDFLP